MRERDKIIIFLDTDRRETVREKEREKEKKREKAREKKRVDVE